MVLGLRACLLALGLGAGRTESGTWHFVDVTQVVCPGSPGEVTVDFPLTGLSSAELHQPHVLTVYRVSLQGVNLSYRLTDSAQPANHTIDDRTVSLKALSNSSRRLRAAEVPEEAEELEDKEEDVKEEVSTQRRPRMLGGKGFFSGSRRRTSPVSPRRRMAPVSPRRRAATVSSPRRRSNAGFAARRRGAAAEPGSRRRTYGVSGSRWGNSQDPRAGHYGYTNQAALNSNFGGRPPATTPYGYSGANAYRPSSGANIAMAVGGGLLAGTMGAYLLNRWSHGWHNLRSQPCTSSTGQHYATCEECRRANPGSQCVAGFGLSVSAARDDLMTTGFVPADVTGPLRLRISQVQGADFLPQIVCPPPGWSPNVSLENTSNVSLENATNALHQNTSWAPSSRQAIFVTLTRVESLGNPNEGGAEPAAGVGAMWPALIAGFCGCFLIACVGVACSRKRQAVW